jgi:geranylgeranyl pyrophosphate synthase
VTSPQAPAGDHPQPTGPELCTPESLRDWTQRVTDELHHAVDTLCGRHSRLPHLIKTLVSHQPTQPHRLLSLVVAAALTGDPEPALPACVASRLWWAGVDALDDLVDSHHPAPGLTPEQTMVAATACITLPSALPRMWPLPAAVQRDWEDEITATTTAAAEGQLAEQLTPAEQPTWARAMTSYRDKNGAAYARDTVMAARLTTTDSAALRGWRAFGTAFGVLRQLRNDRDVRPDVTDEDLANGVLTLELAHALQSASPDDLATLSALTAQARDDTTARTQLRHHLAQPHLAQSYNTKIQAMAIHARRLLDELAPPSPHRTMLHCWVSIAATPPSAAATPA